MAKTVGGLVVTYGKKGIQGHILQIKTHSEQFHTFFSVIFTQRTKTAKYGSKNGNILWQKRQILFSVLGCLTLQGHILNNFRQLFNLFLLKQQKRRYLAAKTEKFVSICFAVLGVLNLLETHSEQFVRLFRNGYVLAIVGANAVWVCHLS